MLLSNFFVSWRCCKYPYSNYSLCYCRHYNFFSNFESNGKSIVSEQRYRVLRYIVVYCNKLTLWILIEYYVSQNSYEILRLYKKNAEIFHVQNGRAENFTELLQFSRGFYWRVRKMYGKYRNTVQYSNRKIKGDNLNHRKTNFFTSFETRWFLLFFFFTLYLYWKLGLRFP